VPYPKKLLNEGEELALDLRPHWWFFSKHIATGIPLFAVGILIALMHHGTPKTVLATLWGVLAVVWAGWLALK